MFRPNCTEAAKYDARYARSFYYFYGGPLELSNEPDVISVTFEISRYGRHSKTLHFDTQVHETQAIRAVETFLSGPMDHEFFAIVKDDLFGWTCKITDFEVRGDALGDCRFLESIDTIKTTKEGRHVKITCGS